MRRLLAVAALGGLALAGAGCGSKPVAPAAAAPSTPSPATSSRGPDPYATNTHEVCSAVNGAVKDGVARFATDLGTMVGHLAGGNQPEADKSRKSAQSRLTELAGNVRGAGAPAADPVLVTAVGNVASRFDALAADPAFLTSVKTVSDVPAANRRVTAATEALAGVCV
jgi:hypothetical protein